MSASTKAIGLYPTKSGKEAISLKETSFLNGNSTVWMAPAPLAPLR